MSTAAGKTQDFIDDNKDDLKAAVSKKVKKSTSTSTSTSTIKPDDPIVMAAKQNIERDFAIASTEIVTENQKYLAGLYEFDIGLDDGKLFKRTTLSESRIQQMQDKRKEIMNIDTGNDDNDFKVYCKKVREMAKLCLKDVTDEELQEADIPLLKEIGDACLLATQGFRKAKRLP